MNFEKSLLQEKINRGIDLFKKNKFDEATQIFDLLKENSESKIISLFFLGIIQTKKKNPLLAKQNFSRFCQVIVSGSVITIFLSIYIYRLP